MEICQLIFIRSGHPIPTSLDPVFGWKKVLSLHSRGLEKAQKQSKIAFFGDIMRSIASTLQGHR